MLTEKMKAQGWIEHDGGPCPVPLDSRPEIMFRSSLVHGPGHYTARDYALCWVHRDEPLSIDIIAYKPEPRP